MGAGAQLGAAATQTHIFDFRTLKKVLYASWGVALGSPGVAVGGRPGVALGGRRGAPVTSVVPRSPQCPQANRLQIGQVGSFSAVLQIDAD